MEIVNQQVTVDLSEGRALKLDLGGGWNPRPGYYSVDMIQCGKTDVVADLSQPLAGIPTGAVSRLYSSHTLEHVSNLLGLMQEINRIVSPGGRIEIIVPHFSNSYAYSDPTHLRFFGIYSMYYFSPPEFQPPRKVPHYYSKARFKVNEVRLSFYRYTLYDRMVAPLLERFLNKSFARLEWYERRLATFFPARQIYFSLTSLPPVEAS